MIQTEIQPEAIVNERNDLSRSETEASVLDILVLLLERKRFIVRFVLGAAALATAVAFLLPIRYEAKIVLLPPPQNSSIGAAMLGQIGNLGPLGSLAARAGGALNLKNRTDRSGPLLPTRTAETQKNPASSLMK